VNVLALNSDSDDVQEYYKSLPGELTDTSLSAALDAIPDDVAADLDTAKTAPPEPMSMQPWAGVDVAWLTPLAGKLLQLPYEQTAKYTNDECWIVTDEQLELINPAFENAIRWIVWRLGMADTVSHPLVAFGVALGSMTAIKYGVYQMNQSRRNAGGPPNPNRNPSPQQSQSPGPNQPTTRPASSTASGRMGESGGESSSSANQGAANLTSSTKGFVYADE
jgi:hypothetical protein